jgi:hypothetical protein
MSLANRAGIAVLLAAALCGSFFITLWLTEPATVSTASITDDRSDVERLAARRISNDVDLLTAAKDIGLYPSVRMRGNIDVLRRMSEGVVSMTGWAADTRGDATPLDILVFVGGAVAAKTQTKGERPDVTEAIHLGFGAEKNVSFSVSFSCRTGEQPVTVSMGTARQYIPLTSGPCP